MSNPNLSADDIAKIYRQIQDIKQKIEDAEVDAKSGSAYCVATVLDFGMMTATVYKDTTTGKLGVSCIVQAPQISIGSGQ